MRSQEKVQSVKKILNLWSYRDLRDGAIFIKPPLPVQILKLVRKIWMSHTDLGYKKSMSHDLHELKLNSLNFPEKFHDKCLSGRSCSWQLCLEPSHIASVLSK
jgi:hypothetical protein